MKLIANITVKIRRNTLPQFIQSLYKHGCSLNTINLTDSDDKWEDYSAEIIHPTRKDLARLLDFLKKNSEYFRDISITGTIEDKIKGGLLMICGKDSLENLNDFQTSLIGGAILLHEKVEAGLASTFCGAFNSVALVSGLRIKKDYPEKEAYHQYTDSERDAVIINRFTGKNGFPLIIKYHTIEDMIKTINSIEQSFSCIRLMNSDEEDVLFNSINGSISVPLISKENDELPLYYLSLIKKIARNNRLRLDQTSVGIIGLPACTMRLTSLLNRSGFMKVLGYDSRERTMMSFENEKGLATTVENILMNTDIVLIMRDIAAPQEIEYFRPGQFVITTVVNEFLNQEKLKSSGIKEFIRLEETDTALLFPGMIKGLVDGGVRIISDDLIIKISDMLMKIMEENYTLPDIFSDIHERIAEITTRG